MRNDKYRYVFSEEVSMDEVEATLVLAIVAAEALHGEAQVRLDAAHAFDRDIRRCVIDAGTEVGLHLNQVFATYLRREFGDDSFSVKRMTDAAAPADAAA